MLQNSRYPLELVQEYLQTSNKLKKFERVVFKKFAPNVAEVSNEFNRLAVKFENACIFQYAGMCYLGSAKCEKSLGNSLTELDFLLKSARAFVKANNEIEKLCLRSNNREYIEGALKSYAQALSKLDDSSVIKAAVIREIKKINPHYEGTSNFSSPSHRIYDLELSSVECIKRKDYVNALEKLTDILDNIIERKKESLYYDLLNKIEITRLLLLIILNLPPSRQSPSHIKLIEKYSSNLNNDDITIATAVATTSNSIIVDDSICTRDGNSSSIVTNNFTEIQFVCMDLCVSWIENDHKNILKAIQELYKFSSLKKEHRMLLDDLRIIYKV